jgi:hypothetical protein
MHHNHSHFIHFYEIFCIQNNSPRIIFKQSPPVFFKNKRNLPNKQIPKDVLNVDIKHGR